MRKALAAFQVNSYHCGVTAVRAFQDNSYPYDGTALAALDFHIYLLRDGIGGI